MGASSPRHDDPGRISAVHAKMQQWRQGDVLQPGLFVHVVDTKAPGTPLAQDAAAAASAGGFSAVHSQALGLVVVSQTCDIVAKRPDVAPFIQFARLVEITDPTKAKNARGGDLPRFAHVPQVGDHHFADLDQIVTIEKAAVAELTPKRGVAGPDERSAFGFAVGRKFSRFAFPDDVHHALQPITEVFRKKHDKPSSPLGAASREVEQIRVSADPDWDSNQIAVSLTFVLPAGALLDLDEEKVSNSERAWFEQTPRSANDLAERLAKTKSPADEAWLWAQLVDAWASSCKLVGVVEAVTADVVCADEMSVAEYWDTEALDLDYLSVASAAD